MQKNLVHDINNWEKTIKINQIFISRQLKDMNIFNNNSLQKKKLKKKKLFKKDKKKKVFIIDFVLQCYIYLSI